MPEQNNKEMGAIFFWETRRPPSDYLLIIGPSSAKSASGWSFAK